MMRRDKRITGSEDIQRVRQKSVSLVIDHNFLSFIKIILMCFSVDNFYIAGAVGQDAGPVMTVCTIYRNSCSNKTPSK